MNLVILILHVIYGVYIALLYISYPPTRNVFIQIATLCFWQNCLDKQVKISKASGQAKSRIIRLKLTNLFFLYEEKKKQVKMSKASGQEKSRIIQLILQLFYFYEKRALKIAFKKCKTKRTKYNQAFSMWLNESKIMIIC